MAAITLIPALLLAIAPAAAHAESAPLAWSAAATIDAGPPYFAGTAGLSDLSCPTPGFCAGVDQSGDVFTSADPAGGELAWSQASVAPAGALQSISCPTASFCAAAGSGQYQRIYTSADPAGGSSAWHLSGASTGSLIACPSAGLCVNAGGDGSMLTSTDPESASARWTGGPVDGNGLVGLACPSTSLCVAVDMGGDVLYSTDPAAGTSSWHQASGTTGEPNLTSLTCPTPAFCAALDNEGQIAYTTTPTGPASAWNFAAAPPDLTQLSCSSATMCAGGGAAAGAQDVDEIYTSTAPAAGPSSWHQYTGSLMAGISAVSCAGTALCVAADDSGYGYASTDPADSAPTWTAPAQLEGTAPTMVVSCPTVRFCAAADEVGQVLTTDDPAGGAGAWTAADVDGSNALTGISCVSAALCVAVDGSGNVLTSADPGGGASAWHTASVGTNLTSVSCASAQFCAVAGSVPTGSGNIQDPTVYTSTDPTGGASAWTSASVPQPGGEVGLGPIACPTTSLCVAGAGAYDQGSWLDTSTNPTGGSSAWTQLNGLDLSSVASVSCPGASLCVVTGGVEASAGEPPAVAVSTSPVGGATAWRLSHLDTGDVVCAADTTECFGFPAAGQMLSSADPATGTWATSPGPATVPDSVSCPTASFCVATESGGQIQVGTPPVATATTAAAPRTAVAGQRVRVQVKVTSAHAGKGAVTPGGGVTVTAGTQSCRAALSGSAGAATGSCRLAEPKPGRYRVSASYSAQGGFAASMSGVSVLAVGRPRSAVRLRLSRSSVRRGHEQQERLTVRVRPQYAGTPGGSVKVLAGRSVLCVVRLRAGGGSCVLSRDRLRAGRYTLRARYLGSGIFLGSYSRTVRLTVTG